MPIYTGRDKVTLQIHLSFISEVAWMLGVCQN